MALIHRTKVPDAVLSAMETETSPLPDAVSSAWDTDIELRLILAMATSFQGGHSAIGREVADYLDIPFPLTTTNLEKKAKECGFEPYDLWPWLKQIRERGSPE